MGAVTNLRPDLFASVVADVPFVDVVNTMLDPTLPLTVIEYDEWGNPTADESAYRYMMSYSPYDNVAAKAYPNLLVTAGLNDPRVAYWEPAKWTAKLRELKTDTKRLLLRTNMGAGHAGASGRYDYLREVAFRYAFVLDTGVPATALTVRYRVNADRVHLSRFLLLTQFKPPPSPSPTPRGSCSPRSARTHPASPRT